MSFTHRLNSRVTLSESGETGKVVGRAQYTTADNSYYIRYKAADGRQVESWWTEGAIADKPKKKAAIKKAAKK